MKRMITLILMISLLIASDGVNDFLNDAGSTITNDDRIHFLDMSKYGTVNALGKEYITYINLYSKLWTDIQNDTLVTDTAYIARLKSDTLDVEKIEIGNGIMSFNDDDYTVDIYTGLGNILQVGQELTLHAKNVDSVALYSGDVVTLVGSQGSRGLVMRADASDRNMAIRLGVVTYISEIGSNDVPVTTFGKVRGFDTSQWPDSTLLYLSADTLGNLTSTPPAFPNFRILIGAVIRSHKTEGVILVQPQLDYTDGVTMQDLYVRDSIQAKRALFERSTVDSVWHGFGGFEDSAIVINIPSQNTWVQVTNADKDLVTGLEADGMTFYGDTLVIDNTGDYFGQITITLSGLNGKDFQVRIYNATQSRQEGFHIGESTTGATNYKNMSLPIYIEATAGDSIVTQIRNTTDDADPTIRSAMMLLNYLHE